MDKDALSVRIAQHWFHRFTDGNFELDDLLHTGRSPHVEMGLLKQLIEEDPMLTTVFNRVTWMLSHCSGNTCVRFRQKVEIYSLDAT